MVSVQLKYDKTTTELFRSRSLELIYTFKAITFPVTLFLRLSVKKILIILTLKLTFISLKNLDGGGYAPVKQNIIIVNIYCTLSSKNKAKE